MDQKIFDCAIIGGGLAGLTLAIQLADSGCTIVLFEKESYPFHKVCGEYISMESYSFLERIGIPLSKMHVPMITEVLVSSVNGTSLTRKLDMGGFGIRRYTLDAELAKLAVQKGVTLLEKTKVIDIKKEGDLFQIKTARGVFSSRIACGSFGKNSVLERPLGRLTAKSAGEKNYVGVKYHIKADLPDNRIELHNFNDGYCGISKVDGDVYCLCYLTGSENLSRSGSSIKAMERDILMQNPFLQRYFTQSRFLYDEPLTISQVTFKRKSQVANGILMLGDAAGSIAPLCGNGMSLAMHASFIAAPQILDYLRGRLTHQELCMFYEKQWKEHFSKRIKTGERIQHLFGKNTLTNAAIGTLKLFPKLADTLIGMTHGKPF
jgi:flavin-dependent dehydrogenase